MIFDSNLINKAKELLDLAKSLNIKIATAESCTGGLVAALLTEIAGSSQVFERGFVTYSNLAKNQLLGVDKNILEEFGAVSSEVAEQMALGAVKNSAANLSVAITGIAGPDGGTKEKPIGLVHIASYCQLNEEKINKKSYFSGSRNEIRIFSLALAIEILTTQLTKLKNE